MFALCSRFNRPVAHMKLHCAPRAPLQARHYSSEPPGNAFPKGINTIFLEKLPKDANAPEAKKNSFHSLSEEQESILRTYFESDIHQLEERSGMPFDPDKKEVLWQMVMGMVRAYRKELGIFAQLVDSKEGDELKRFFLVEVAKTQAWNMLEEICSDMFPDRAPLNLSLPERRPSETEKGRAVLEKTGYSAGIFNEISESVLQSVFFTIWQETKPIHSQNSNVTYEQLRKRVSEMRLGQLENRILFQVLETRELSEQECRDLICVEYGKRREVVQYQMKALKEWLAWE